MTWAILTLLVIVPVARRYPLNRGASLARDLTAHGMAAIVLASTQTAIVAFTTATIYYGISPLATRDIFVDRTFSTFALNVLVYVTIVAVVRARQVAAEN